MKLSLGRLGSTLLATGALSFVACSGVVVDDPKSVSPSPLPSATVEPVAPPPAKLEAPKPTIAWGSCDVPGSRGNVTADCATVDLPARRGIVDSGTVPIAIYRLKAKNQPATAQMWMLNGGPGGAGFDLAPFGELVAQGFSQAIDVYLIDHRGTGESEFLDCPKALRFATTTADYAKKCSVEIRDSLGAKLDGFSTTESAHDIRELIDATAEKDQKVYVYGGSYGSYWAHRLVQLPNVRVDAVVTDGNCISSTCSFDSPQTFGVDETMKYILDVCKETPSCSAKLGPDPAAFARNLLGKLKTGHCATAKLSTWAPADILMSLGPVWAAGILPTLHRLDRCSEADVRVLNELEKKLRAVNQRGPVPLPRLGPTPRPSKRTSVSTALQLHVIASEMISRPIPSRDALAAKAASLTFQPGEGSLDLSYFGAWQGYPRDGFVDGYATRDVPWLMMQGTFDFQTVFSLSQAALPKIKNPSLQFVKVDGGGHGVVFDSDCAIMMLESFLANPRAPVDARCTSDVKRDSLMLDSRYTQYFFGTPNAWD